MHHNDSPNLDPRTDITDIFVFQKPGDPSRSILILNVNPEAPTRAGFFDPRASYEIKIDSNADFVADAAFHFLFSRPRGGHQNATIYLATGDDAQKVGAVGEVVIQRAPVSFGGEAQIVTSGQYRFFAGMRSDPFFADPEGFINNMQWTGRDFWGGKNVFSIVVDTPNSIFGANPRVSVWGRTLVPVHGVLTPVNQVGLPGTNVIRQGADTNTTPQPLQRELFSAQYSAWFRNLGYDESEANQLALQWLPDVLPYDCSSAAGFPNGRRLTDDVIDNLVEILSRGMMKDDLLTAHTNFLEEFPYLGIPHNV